MSDRNRAPTACDTIDIAGIGEKPATRSGPYSLDGVHVRGRDRSPAPRPRRPGPARPCRGPAGSGGAAPGRPGCRPRPRPGRRAAPWPRGTSRPARRARTGSAPGSASRCTRRTRRPAGSRAARTRAGPGRRRVVGLLRLPGDDAVLDVDLPRARAGAVHAVGGAHDLVVGPAVPVEGVGLPAADLVQGPAVRRDLRPAHQAAHRQQGPPRPTGKVPTGGILTRRIPTGGVLTGRGVRTGGPFAGDAPGPWSGSVAIVPPDAYLRRSGHIQRHITAARRSIGRYRS